MVGLRKHPACVLISKSTYSIFWTLRKRSRVNVLFMSPDLVSEVTFCAIAAFCLAGAPKAVSIGTLSSLILIPFTDPHLITFLPSPEFPV